MAGYDRLLIGGYDPHGNLAAGRADAGAMRSHWHRRVKRDAEPSQLGADRCANGRCVLADATREDDAVNAAQAGR